MDKQALPPGLVMWPAGTSQKNRLCVLISDIHCTDCTVGNLEGGCEGMRGSTATRQCRSEPIDAGNVVRPSRK